MNNTSSNTLGWIVGILLAMVTILTGNQLAQGLKSVSDAQAIALENLRIWKAAYQALLPVKERWNSTFQVGVGSNEQDLVRIFSSLRLAESGLDADDTQIRGEKVESVTFNSVSVGLVRTCVGGESSGVKVNAKTMGGMIRGLEKMVRPDIEVGSISTMIDLTGRPMTIMGGLCVLVRGEG